MTPTPDPQSYAQLAEQVVRHVAAGTGLTTIVTVGISADGVPVVTQDGFTPHELDASYERLLDDHRRPGAPAPARRTDLRVRPDPARTRRGLPAPPRHRQRSGPGAGRRPQPGRPADHPAPGQPGLAALMQALADTQSTRPAAARRVPRRPQRPPGVLPATQRHRPPAGLNSVAPTAEPFPQLLEASCPSHSRPPRASLGGEGTRPASMRDQWAELISTSHSPAAGRSSPPRSHRRRDCGRPVRARAPRRRSLVPGGDHRPAEPCRLRRAGSAGHTAGALPSPNRICCGRGCTAPAAYAHRARTIATA